MHAVAWSRGDVGIGRVSHEVKQLELVGKVCMLVWLLQKAGAEVIRCEPPRLPSLRKLAGAGAIVVDEGRDFVGI